MVRPYRRLSVEQRQALWSRWRAGESLLQIAEALGTHKSNVWWVVQRRGGLAPARRQRAASALQAWEREEISRGLAQEDGVRSMAPRLHRPPSTISPHIRRPAG